MTGYKKLNAWKKSTQLTKAIYMLVKSYPKEELYALTSQTKRAAVSIPSNIAEGMGRNHKKDTIQFLYIARGSSCELETLLEIARMLDLITDSKYIEISSQSEECQEILNGFISYFEKKI